MTLACAAVLEVIGHPLVLREFPLPVLQSGEMLVEVIACTLCGSDLHSLNGKRTVPLPTILGHEILGRIFAFGPATGRHDAAGQLLNIGDRVTWSIVAHCGDCFYCRSDLPQKCLRQTKYGHEPLRPGRELTGGLASHCLLATGTSVFRVPDELSDSTACPASCATATIGAAMEAAGNMAGKHVLVLGAGMLGITAVAWVQSLGASVVIGCDVARERLELARSFGATHVTTNPDLQDVVRETTDGRGIDIVLELTGSPDAFEAALPLIRTGGTAILLGSVFPSRPVPVALEKIVRNCLTMRGIHNYGPRHLKSALEFLTQHPELPFENLVSSWHRLNDINQTLSTPLPSHSLRIGIRP